ncbi:MAG TPA: hypothetical protein VK911_17925 [Vicinamibacterales bacterium]|nr:hypothetical protein [Vicinamibacterales bacterium]
MTNGDLNDGRKLHGWKDIAGHFGRTTRTVQRWERELGLPVHRMGLARGDAVYAIVSELQAWQEATETEERGPAAATSDGSGANGGSGANDTTANGGSGTSDADADGPPAENLQAQAVPTSRRGAWVGLGVVGAAVAILALSRIPLGDAAPADPPTRAVVEGQALRVLSADGRELWRHAFERPVHEANYANPPWSRPRPLEFCDLDGDHSRELLAAVMFSDPKHGMPLYCFEADGRLRFSWLPSRPVSFGGQEFAPPFVAGPTLLTEGKGRRALWASAVHHLNFPAVVARLDAQGHQEAEFWTNGSVTTLASGEFFGRAVVLIGAAHNQFQSGGLVVIDAEDPSGSMPASVSKYRCDDCPAGTPLASFVFPVPDLVKQAGAGAIPGVREILLNEAGLTVSVRYTLAGEEGLNEALVAGAWYTFDRDLRPIRAELFSSYPAAHRRAERAGLIDHEYRGEEEEAKELFPILSWNGTEYVPVSPAAKK